MIMGRIIDAGHYYECHGPTEWSVVGWRVLEDIRVCGDEPMLFIDDVHTRASPQEICLPLVPFSPCPHHLIMESEMHGDAMEVLACLKELPGKKRARRNRRWGCWMYLGFSLTDACEFPLCLLFDLGLTLHKHVTLGFSEGVNILPYYYKDEQCALVRIAKKIFPEFSLRVILYDLEGNVWDMEDK